MDRFLEQIAVRAATIDELLSEDFECLPGQKADADVAARRLAAWCKASASGDWSLFARRLARDGVTIESVMKQFATVRRRPGAPLPAWVKDAEWIAAALSRTEKLENSEVRGETGQPAAYEDLLQPVVGAACSEVIRRASCVADCLTPSGLTSIKQLLMQRLSDLCAPALYDLFANIVGMEAGGSGEDLGRPGRYDRFVDRMRHGGARALFEQRPVLLRLMASIARQWIETTIELVTRLQQDRSTIHAAFFEGRSIGLVCRVCGNLGDLHNFGRSVLIVEFAGGDRVVYKPRDLCIDERWAQLIDRLNGSDPPIHLRTPRVLPMAGYGWCEYIEKRDCEDDRGFETFYRRAGAWLSLFHVLVGTDMHEENLIAHGDHPVPIDLEMLLQPGDEPPLEIGHEQKAFRQAAAVISDSVLMTGLLPVYGRTPEHDVYGHGGLQGQEMESVEAYWDNINTDEMRPAQRKKMKTANSNVPQYQGRVGLLIDHLPTLLEGFRAYSALLERFRRTDEGRTLLDAFSGIQVRVILKPTNYYSLLLHRARDYRHMYDGVEWSARIDFGSRLADWEKEDDRYWPLLKAERRALVELNVPYFVVKSDTSRIHDLFGAFADTSRPSGMSVADRRWRQLGETNTRWQCEVIELSTSALALSVGPLPGPEAVRLPDASFGVGKSELRHRAGQIARQISDLAIRTDGGAAWIGFDWLGDSPVCQLSPLGASLYNGSPGVSLFLAAYARVSGDSGARQLAVEGLSAVRHTVRGVSAGRFARGLGVGGMTGLGSVVYSLTTIGELLAEKELLEDARQAAALFTDELIEVDQLFDVLDGSAGAILSLLKLYRATGDQEVLSRAKRCGEHFLAYKPWKSGGDAVGQKGLLNGMSHGAAGMAYALACLARITQQEHLGPVVRQLVEYENHSYSPGRLNWPDFRMNQHDLGPWPCQWCHGAAGIGLARIGSVRLGMIPQEDVVADVRSSVACVLKTWPYWNDSLCCGALGNIELLVEAGRILGERELGFESERRLHQVLLGADARGDYLWTVGNRRFNLGLFRGLAGVGYAMLRLSNPDLPSVLLLE